MKKCSSCNNDVILQKNGKCRICNTEYMRMYRIKNKQKIKEYQKKYDKNYYKTKKEKILKNKKNYYKKNKNNIILNNKNYYINNIKEKKRYNSSYYKKNKEKILSNVKNYYNKNKIKLKIYNNQYLKKKRLYSKNFRIRTSISANINYYIKYSNASKDKKSCIKYLPYTIDELKNHLELNFEPWMSWENYGKFNSKIWNDNDQSTWTWQIDHIIPQSKLLYTNMLDANFKKCWSLSNLRPLSSKQNFLDGVFRTRH